LEEHTFERNLLIITTLFLTVALTAGAVDTVKATLSKPSLSNHLTAENPAPVSDYGKVDLFPFNTVREVTAYNVGDPSQTSGDPCIAANGENICAALEAGMKRCAANFVPFGTRLEITQVGVCTVTDRMNRRYRSRVDIAMNPDEKDKALQFGIQKLRVKILTTG
jgi:3D (Asp-Asp-Asp) domain-containing protein